MHQQRSAVAKRIIKCFSYLPLALALSYSPQRKSTLIN